MLANRLSMPHPHPYAKPPFQIERHGSLVIIVDRNGINWGLADEHGAIGFYYEEEAKAWADRHGLDCKDTGREDTQ